MQRMSIAAGGLVLAALLQAAPAGAQLFITERARTVTGSYHQGATLIEQVQSTGLAPDPLAVRLDTAITDTFVVGTLPTGPGYTRSTLYGVGASSVSVNAQLNNSIVDAQHILRAVVSETTRGTSAAGVPRTLTFSFYLKDALIELWDLYGAPASESNPLLGPSDSIGARIEYEVQRDGVTAYRSSTDAWGGITGPFRIDQFHRRVDGYDVDGAQADNWSPADPRNPIGSPGEVPRGFAYKSFSVDRLDLGTVGAYETFEVTATMSATLVLPPTALGAGGRISLGDPNDLGDYGSTQVALVPEPASVAMMGVGLSLVLLVAWRRRQDAPSGPVSTGA